MEYMKIYYTKFDQVASAYNEFYILWYFIFSLKIYS